MKENRYYGFTLAEILITLAIIGVVAALTIPSVIINNQKIQFEAKLKKTYNALQNAVLLSVAQNGSPASWGAAPSPNSSDAEAFLGRYIFPYLKIAKQSSDCAEIFGYTGYKNVKGNNVNEVPYSPSSNQELCRYAAELNDGTIIAFSTAGNPNAGRIFFIYGIDLNGKKGPNRLGYDLFKDTIFIKNDNGKIVPSYLYNNNGYLLDHLKLVCTGVTGDACLAYVMKNGWKIDY